MIIILFTTRRNDEHNILYAKTMRWSHEKHKPYNNIILQQYWNTNASRAIRRITRSASKLVLTQMWRSSIPEYMFMLLTIEYILRPD